jgi:hypothetical protein
MRTSHNERHHRQSTGHRSHAGGGTYGSPYLGGIRDIQYIDCAVVRQQN